MSIEECRWRPLVGMYYKVNLAIKELQNNTYKKKRKLQKKVWYDLGVVHDSRSQCIGAMCTKKEPGNHPIAVMKLLVFRPLKTQLD